MRIYILDPTAPQWLAEMLKSLPDVHDVTTDEAKHRLQNVLSCEEPIAPVKAHHMNECGYAEHAEAWIARLPRDRVMAKWQDERDLRNACKVSGPVRDDLLKKVEAKAHGRANSETRRARLEDLHHQVAEIAREMPGEPIIKRLLQLLDEYPPF
jgi:hypothetical protein